jgi:hypothetical protein
MTTRRMLIGDVDDDKLKFILDEEILQSEGDSVYLDIPKLIEVVIQQSNKIQELKEDIDRLGFAVGDLSEWMSDIAVLRGW